VTKGLNISGGVQPSKVIMTVSHYNFGWQKMNGS